MSSRLLYFVRHGQTDWNATDKIQGQTDTPLNDLGRSQARRNGVTLAKALNTTDGFRFVSSPLDRARDTMEIIRSEIGLPKTGYDIDERLIEVNYGDWQGHSWRELRTTKAEEIDARFADLWGTVPPSGESYQQASERIITWLSSTRGNMIIVTHGGIMRCVHGHIAGVFHALRPKLDVPHDKILLIENNEMHWI